MNNRRILFRIVPLLLAGVFVLFQYFSAEKVKNPLTGHSARVALSRSQEDALGLQAYQEVLSHERTITSGAQSETARRVAERLAQATGKDASGFDWRVSVVDSQEKNAFCLPGGKIVVYTGILPLTQTDAGLAAVLGHEMAHATLHHGGQRIFRDNLTQTLMQGAAVSIADMDYNQQRAIMGALGVGARYGASLPFGRKDESEADALGLIYMARAGYDPREAIAFWKRMSEASSGAPPQFLSTHPSDATRIARLEDEMPKAVAEYERATQGGGN